MAGINLILLMTYYYIVKCGESSELNLIYIILHIFWSFVFINILVIICVFSITITPINNMPQNQPPQEEALIDRNENIEN